MSRVNVKFMKVSKNILCTGLNEVDTENEGRFTIDSNYQIKCNYFDETSSNNKITMTNGGRLLTTNGMFVEGFEEDYPLTQAIYSSIYVCTVSGGTVGSQITNLPYPATGSSYALVIELNPNLTFTAVNGAEISWSQQSSIIVADTILDTTNKRVIIKFNIDTSSTPRMFNNGSISATLYEISYTDKSGKSVSKPSETLPATDISYMHEYTYTTGTLPTGVGSITANRSQSAHSPEGTSTGTIASGTKIYAGDKLYFSATAATGYGAPNVQYNSSSNALTVSGNVTGSSYVTGAGVNTYAVTIAAGTGVSSVYLSTSSTATSGSASGTKFNYNSTVYGFAKLSTGYSAPSGWTLVSGTANSNGAIYRVGSKVVTSAQNFGTVSATVNTYAVTIAKGTGVSAVYLSTNSNATSGSASGTKFNYGSTVYAFATLSSGYSASSGWTLVSGSTYRVSSKTVSTSGNDFGTITAGLSSYTVSITAGSNITAVALGTSATNTASLDFGPSASGSYSYGSTVYAFAVNESPQYAVPSGWTSLGNGIYRVGSVTVSGNYTFTAPALSTLKTFTYSTGTLPTGVASITAYRAPYNNTGSYSAISNGATITYGDRMYFTATPSTGYNNPTVSKNSSSNYITVSGNVIGTDYVTAGSQSVVQRNLRYIEFKVYPHASNLNLNNTFYMFVISAEDSDSFEPPVIFDHISNFDINYPTWVAELVYDGEVNSSCFPIELDSDFVSVLPTGVTRTIEESDLVTSWTNVQSIAPRKHPNDSKRLIVPLTFYSGPDHLYIFTADGMITETDFDTYPQGYDHPVLTLPNNNDYTVDSGNTVMMKVTSYTTCNRTLYWELYYEGELLTSGSATIGNEVKYVPLFEVLSVHKTLDGEPLRIKAWYDGIDHTELITEAQFSVNISESTV